MKKNLLCLGFALTMRFTALPATDYYISPSGKDTNPGSYDKPFATLERARQAIRQSDHKKPIHVFLREGIYYLTSAFVLTAEESGNAKAPVSFEAYHGEKPVISGGCRLDLTWIPFKGNIMKAQVPEGFITDQLFVNGIRQQMARYPDFDSTSRYFNGYAEDALSSSRTARWKNPRNGFIHAMHRSLWGDFHYLITGRDSSGAITYEGGWQNNRKMGMHPVYRFVENIFEELDAPGEWFLDPQTHTLYYYPQPGIDIRNATIEAVRLKHLIELRGSEEKPIRNISFQGITFRHSARTYMDTKEPMLRSDWTIYRGGAIFLTGTEDCKIENCFLDQLGGNAIFVSNYNRGVTIRGCHIANAGANGVAFAGDPASVRSALFEYHQVQKAEEMDKTPGPKNNNYPSDCLVDNCLIYRTGRFEKQTAPIEIDMAQRITVRHCSIYDVPRAGINIGDGCWGGHVIEYCDVFETVKETGDHGSFNSWGRDRFWRPNIAEINEWVKENPELPLLDAIQPNILRNNRWRCDHGWDIDLDDGSSNYRIYNNLCLNGGIKNREGYHRLIENNIIVNNSYYPHAWLANSGDTVRFNIFWDVYRPAKMYPPPWGNEMDYNFRQQKNKTSCIDSLLAKKSGRDSHSQCGDALFIDPSRGDFRLRKNSPVFALGFKSFPLDEFGVQIATLKVIAKIPAWPSCSFTTVKRNSSGKEWQQCMIRNIQDEGEMSAYGLSGVTGVLVLEVFRTSPIGALGVKKDDVIVAVNGTKIESTEDLLPIKHPVNQLTIVRNQKEMTLKTIHE